MSVVLYALRENVTLFPCKGAFVCIRGCCLLLVTWAEPQVLEQEPRSLLVGLPPSSKLLSKPLLKFVTYTALLVLQCSVCPYILIRLFLISPVLACCLPKWTLLHCLVLFTGRLLGSYRRVSKSECRMSVCHAVRDSSCLACHEGWAFYLHDRRWKRGQLIYSQI